MSSLNHIHFVSLNVQGLRDRYKRLRVLQWLKNQKAYIVFLQETHFTEDIIDIISQDFENWRFFNSYGKNLCRGCSIMIKKDIPHNIKNYFIDDNGRYVLINVELHDNPYCQINIYAPNDKKTT